MSFSLSQKSDKCFWNSLLDADAGQTDGFRDVSTKTGNCVPSKKKKVDALTDGRKKSGRITGRSKIVNKKSYLYLRKKKCDNWVANLT